LNLVKRLFCLCFSPVALSLNFTYFSLCNTVYLQ
jgi:hypothetical protein